MDALRRLVEVWRTAVADFDDLARHLSDDEWRLPTDLAGWSVGDVVAHVAAVEAELAGDELRAAEFDPAAPHITGALGLHTEQGVVARRDDGRERVVQELDRSVRRRAAFLADDPLDEPDGTPSITPAGVDWTWHTLLRNRAVDVWVHEQDIRRAVGKPGHLDTAGAAHVQAVFAAALPYVVAKRVEAPAGTTVTFDVTGPLPGVYAVEVDTNRRGRAITPSPDRPTLRFALDTESFTILGAGRRDPDRLPVRIEGDGTAHPAMAKRILAAMNLTAL